MTTDTPLPPLPDVLSCDPRINGQLVHHIRTYAHAARAPLLQEIERLRNVVCKTAAEIGAGVSPKCSIEFMEILPAEAGTVMFKMRKRLAEAEGLLKEARKGQWTIELLDRIDAFLEVYVLWRDR